MFSMVQLFGRRSRSWIRLAQAALAVVVLGCAACTSTDSPDSAGVSSNSAGDGQPGGLAADGIPQIGSEVDLMAGWAFPLDAYALTRTQRDLIYEALNVLETKCMAEQGFVVPPWLPRLKLSTRNRLLEEFGVGILSEARQYGYEVPPEYTGADHPVDTTKPPPEVSQAYQEAMTGPPQDMPEAPMIQVGDWSFGTSPYAPDSCMGRSYEALGVSFERSQELGIGQEGSVEVTKLVYESRDRTEADPRVSQVTADWAACMAGRGFDTPSPGEAVNTYGPQGNSPAAVAAATAEIGCKYETNYFGVLYGVTAEYQRQLIDQGLAGLETLAASNREILDKANAAIAAG
ncbi:MAG: hypothetical protein LBL55_09155 [Propionibacteriaceae bacterium]|nr:hypothetical protein [Propionibacteriaceae bacterium]